jgi:hypothetical protein
VGDGDEGEFGADAGRERASTLGDADAAGRVLAGGRLAGFDGGAAGWLTLGGHGLGSSGR